MKMLNQSNTRIDHLSSPANIIKELAAKSEDNEYIYRGEPECYVKVSSPLYREYANIGAESLALDIIQKKMLNEAKKLTFEIDDSEILIEIQHNGGRTNLIDFTTDYLIALFFACDAAPNKDGRVIRKKTETIKDIVKHPRNPRHHVKTQKTVFVISPNGLIEPDEDDIVIIPAALKQPLLQYLRMHYNISTETIYNDLYSFIKNQDIHRIAYMAFYSGFIFQNIGNEAESPEEKHTAYEKSITYYTEALKKKPDLLEAYINLGIVNDDMDNVIEALENYNTAIQLDPCYTEAYYNRGFAYLNKEDLDQAFADFSKVIELKPEHAEAYYYRGLISLSKEDFEQGLHDCNIAIQLNPDDADTYNLRGAVYACKGDFDNAFKDHTKAIELQPDEAHAYNSRGIAYSKILDFDNAVKDFDKALQRQPDYAEAYYNRGNVYSEKDEFDSAIKDYSTTIELQPDVANTYYNRGIAYAKKGEFDNAITDYDKVIDINPDDAEAYCNRGEASLHLQEWKKAKSDLITAKEMGIDIIALFQNDYLSVTEFEEKTGIQLPKDIAALLTPPQT